MFDFLNRCIYPVLQSYTEKISIGIIFSNLHNCNSFPLRMLNPTNKFFYKPNDVRVIVACPFCIA